MMETSSSTVPTREHVLSAYEWMITVIRIIVLGANKYRLTLLCKVQILAR
nr:MAG TPA: hypothetical protein [Caudoviricetes sp.]